MITPRSACGGDCSELQATPLGKATDSGFSGPLIAVFHVIRGGSEGLERKICGSTGVIVGCLNHASLLALTVHEHGCGMIHRVGSANESKPQASSGLSGVEVLCKTSRPYRVQD